MAEENANDGDDVRWSIGLKVPRHWAGTVILAIGLTLILGLYSFVRCDGACSQYFVTQAQKIHPLWLWSGFPIPILGFWGIWLATRRFRQTDKIIKLQIHSQAQQRFFDAVRLLDSQSKPVQFAALESLKQVAEGDDLEYHSEAFTLLRSYLEEHGTEAEWQDKQFGIATGDQIISRLELYAFLALASLGQPKNLRDQNYRPKRRIIGFCLVGISTPFSVYFDNEKPYVTERTKIDSIEFKGCDLRSCNFSGAILTNVSFARNGLPTLNTDLTDASFHFAVLRSVGFSNSNISGVDFSACSGLTRYSLAACVYDFKNPPHGLPNGLILGPPSFEFVFDEGRKKVKPLDASCIPDFCELHDGFAPHGERDKNFVITVSPPPDDPSPAGHAIV